MTPVINPNRKSMCTECLLMTSGHLPFPVILSSHIVWSAQLTDNQKKKESAHQS